ncbi:L-aspartate oxidase [Dermabacteraceae bacterium P7006]
MTKHVLIVGAGVAGLSCALELCALGGAQITLVSKDALGQANTLMAQSGVAGAWHPDDSVALHRDDTLASGNGIGVTESAQFVADNAVAAIAQLEKWGVTWDYTTPADDSVGERELSQLEPRQTGGHSFPRSAHAGGDRTGRLIAFSLRDRVQEAAAQGLITVREKEMVRDLLVEDGRVVGVELLGKRDADGNYTPGEQLRADAVVLATGGAGGMFAVTTNLRGAVGGSVALAYRAGAVIRDPEFFQFHPTSLDAPGFPLIGEAVRGRGAHIIDANGERFLHLSDERGELASRDIVARAIYRRRQETGGQVFLDARPIGTPEELSAMFPGMSRQIATKRLTWDDPIPITPAAHYWMGGIASTVEGRTSLPGLFAVGEAGCNGVHGANRLATNSLLEGCVTGRACAALLAREDDPAPRDLADLELHRAEVPAPTAAPSEEPASLAALQTLMWEKAGVVRDPAELAAAREQVLAWLSALPAEAQTRQELELRDALTSASLLLGAALMRKETRGAHTRADFPQTDEVAVSRGFHR